MKKNIFIVILLLFFSLEVKSQKHICKIEIDGSIEVIDMYKLWNNFYKDTVYNNEINIIFTPNHKSCFLYKKNLKNNNKVFGQYGHRKYTKEKVMAENPYTGFLERKIDRFYSYRKDGVWLFLDEKDNLVKIEFWKKGKLLKILNFKEPFYFYNQTK